MNNKIDEIRSVGIKLRPNSPELAKYFHLIKEYLLEKEIDVYLDEKSAKSINLVGIEKNKMFQICDILISIGGDGTLLGLARDSFMYQKPILGVNLGSLGFLTDISPDEIIESLERIFSFDYRIDERMVMEITTKIQPDSKKYFAVNDLVIKHKLSKMIHIDLFVNDELANRYHGDALIISTPTGSTGYNLSAGGPIVFPYSQCFIFTPICAHSLTQRSIVIPTGFDIKLKTQETDIFLNIDGQDHIDFSSKDLLFIKTANKSVKMIHKKDRNFFKITREKLNWGDSRI